jgi:hypothetical protein
MSLPVAVLLLTWMVGSNGPIAQVSIKRIGLPIFGVLAMAGGAMGFYNWRVTGDALRMPYQVHEATYAVAPVFLWQHPRPEPAYRHKVIRDFHTGWELQEYRDKRAAPGRWMFFHWSHDQFRSLPYPLVLTVPLIILPWILRDRWSHFALLTWGLFVAGLLMESWYFLHYAAPITALGFALVLQGMRQLRLWHWRNWQTGRFMLWTLVMLYVTVFVMAFAQQMQDHWSTQPSHRARILAQLKEADGYHLVLVRYGPQYPRSPFIEWVYNDADIDSAKVVWARDMDSAHNHKLLEYFKDRHVWLVKLEEGYSSPKLVPYHLGSLQ